MTGAVPPFRAAPADFIASVNRPSRMLPGDGFISNPEPTACACASYVRIKSAKRTASSGLTQRSIRSCSDPSNSGNSARSVVPPSALSRSEVCPMPGFAEIPEKPSEPPHLSPTESADNGAAARVARLASMRPANVSRIAAPISASSVPIRCCSNTNSGFANAGSRRAISSRSMSTCAC